MIHEGVEVEHTDSKTIAAKSATVLLDDCKSTAKAQLASDPQSASSILESLSACVQKGIADEIEKANEEIAFQAEVRKDMAALVENYTCADETMNTTEAKRTEYWNGRKVEIMIDRPASRIHTIQNFLTEDECQAVEAAAKPILHDATVADGSGGVSCQIHVRQSRLVSRCIGIRRRMAITLQNYHDVCTIMSITCYRSTYRRMDRKISCQSNTLVVDPTMRNQTDICPTVMVIVTGWTSNPAIVWQLSLCTVKYPR